MVGGVRSCTSTDNLLLLLCACRWVQFTTSLPLPMGIGVDEGNVITEVDAGGAGATQGLEVGDELLFGSMAWRCEMGSWRSWRLSTALLARHSL